MKGFILEVKSCCVLSIVHSAQVEIMQLFLVWMMIFMFHTGSSEDLVKSLKDVMLALEGDNVTLSCNYSGSVQNLYWYQQKSSSSPQLLIAEYSEKTAKLSLIHDKKTKEFHLQISSAAVTDSAVYYCAVRPDQGYKMYFGSGTKLTVESEEEYEPSYYKLGDNETALCLATGFSRHNVTNSSENSIFTKIEAVRISDDALFNQVAWISSENEKKCKEEEDVVTCEDTLEPDPMVNLMSLTVLGLRVILLKTIVFNVLMTLRLWISQ